MSRPVARLEYRRELPKLLEPVFEVLDFPFGWGVINLGPQWMRSSIICGLIAKSLIWPDQTALQRRAAWQSAVFSRHRLRRPVSLRSC
jgi:hypothetical protein